MIPLFSCSAGVSCFVSFSVLSIFDLLLSGLNRYVSEQHLLSFGSAWEQQRLLHIFCSRVRMGTAELLHIFCSRVAHGNSKKDLVVFLQYCVVYALGVSAEIAIVNTGSRVKLSVRPIYFKFLCINSVYCSVYLRWATVLFVWGRIRTCS